jgi:hypothetical protein
MPNSRVWQAKAGAPPYVEIRTADVWGQVKAKWQSLGSPEAQCPVGRFGAAGSLENEECKRRVAPLWDRFENVFPDLPKTGPYNNLVDLVPVEEVCQLGFYDDPEADIGDAPNLFQNPAGLAQKLQEWFLRSKIPEFCEVAPIPPLEGGCFCWPYFVTVRFITKGVGDLDWSPVNESTSPAFGPIRGVGFELTPSRNGNLPGYNIFINGQLNPGGFRYGNIQTCEIGSQRYPTAAGSGFEDVQIISVGPIVPFTVEDIDFYGLGYATAMPSGDGFCPLPDATPPLPNYPNTRGVYVPLPVPIISFPTGTGCPLPEDNLNITIELNVDAPLAGADGAPGEKGKDGPTVIKQILKTRGSDLIGTSPPNGGTYGGVYPLPRGCAYVAIKFNVDGVTQSNYSGQRVFFSPADDYERRKEIGLGNAYLRMKNTSGMTLERMVLSMGRTLVFVPESAQELEWELVVNDKGDVGFEVEDLGHRHVLRQLDNIDDIDSLYYSEPY